MGRVTSSKRKMSKKVTMTTTVRAPIVGRQESISADWRGPWRCLKGIPLKYGETHVDDIQGNLIPRKCRQRRILSWRLRIPQQTSILAFYFLHAFYACQRHSHVEPLVRDFCLAWHLSGRWRPCGGHGRRAYR